MIQKNAEELNRLISERILILDGAMGSMLQEHKLSDILCLEKPELILDIHKLYLEAGADIISSCSFNANAVSLADYKIAGKAYDISRAAGALARQAADEFSTVEKKRFAAGSMGPTPKSASFCHDINDPGKRSIGWDELEAAYYDNARGLLDGGVDILLIETIFDTINAKAAIAAVIRLREERDLDIPLIISATIANDAGRLLSGQTLEAFAVSVSHAEPFALGLNCSFGAEKIFPHLNSFSGFSPFPVICYPNAGLPAESGDYYEEPEKTAEAIKKFFEKKLVNIIGGCCGTTPAHIAAIAELAKNYQPRPLENLQIKEPLQHCYLSGLEVFPPISDAGGQSGNSPVFPENMNDNTIVITGNDPGSVDDAVELAEEIIDGGARILPVRIDSELPCGKETVTRFFNTALFFPAIARIPIMLECSNTELLEAALKCIQGKSLISCKNISEEEIVTRHDALFRRYGATALR